MKHRTTTIDRNGNERVRIQTINNLPTKTQQQFASQCEINNIIKKYQKTGQWLHVTSKQGVYADVSQISDYAESLQKVLNANSAFNSLPSNLRARFENDPSQLLAFLQDSNNKEEAISLGLIPKPSTPEKVNDDKTTNTKTGKSDPS